MRKSCISYVILSLISVGCYGAEAAKQETIGGNVVVNATESQVTTADGKVYELTNQAGVWRDKQGEKFFRVQDDKGSPDCLVSVHDLDDFEHSQNNS